MSLEWCCPYCHTREFTSKTAFRTHRQFCEYLAVTVLPNTGDLGSAATVSPVVYQQVVRNLVVELTKTNQTVARLSATVASLRQRQLVPLKTHFSGIPAPRLRFDQWIDTCLPIHAADMAAVASGGLIHGIVSCVSRVLEEGVEGLPILALPDRAAKVYAYSGTSNAEAAWGLLTIDDLFTQVNKVAHAFRARYFHPSVLPAGPISEDRPENEVLLEMQHMKAFITPVKKAETTLLMRALVKYVARDKEVPPESGVAVV